jgi:hypothetical protein
MQFRAAAENPLRSRDDVARLLRDLVAPLIAHFTPGRAGIRLGANLPWYGEPAASLEGFARPLWGLVPAAMGGKWCPWWPLWREGLIHGTDPVHPEFWGWPADRDQRCVELPILALGAALAPAELWTPLSATERERALAWFARINDVELVDNNWLFFRVLTQLALRRLGAAWSRERLAADLRRLDQFYLGDGWYADGEQRRGDYYVAMAFHTYGLIFARLADETESGWTEKFRARAHRFAADFQHWFAADGEAIPFGRSLTYRTAQGAFWGALAFADEAALPWPIVKGFYLRHLRWWMRQPIFSETGVLSVGYRYPNLLMAENYNGPGSPYWAFKIFLPLALGAEHPFWRADEAPAPPRPTMLTVPNSGLVVSSDRDARMVVALNAGQPVVDYPRHAAEKYSKFAYASHFGFGVPSGGATLANGGFDSVLALSEDGVRFRGRDTCREQRIENGVVSSLWQPWPDVTMRTWLIADGTLHVRVHRLETGRPLSSTEAGFALAYQNPRDVVACEATPGALLLQSSFGCTALRDLSGPRATEKIFLEPNTHLQSPLAAMPVLRTQHNPGVTWLACVVGAWPEPDETLLERLREFSAAFANDTLSVSRQGKRLFEGLP